MNTTKIIIQSAKAFFLGLLSVCMTACSGDDDGGSDPTPTPVGPSVVSWSLPDTGEGTVPVGDASIIIVYDQAIRLTSTDKTKILVTNATVTSMTASGKALSLKVNCPDYNTTVTVTIPQGLLVNADAVGANVFRLTYTTEKQPTPVDPTISSTPVAATTESAKKLYTYMVAQYGQKILSSVMANVNWNNNLAEKVNTLTGKYPAMNCYDFIHIHVPNQGSNGWINYNDITPVKNWADAGGIVQLMWHFNVPKSESTVIGTDGSGVTCSPGETTFKASNALVSGTWENKWFYQEMDKVVAVLLKLQDAGIAATWRPFHEAAGNATLKSGASWGKAWFWWGYDGAATFKKLYIAMFDYFKQKGVSNLIWVWTTQNYNGDSSQYYQDTDWYPGDQYVDIVARDLYGATADQNAQEFTEIQSKYANKMVVLGECGYGTVNNNRVEQGSIGTCWTKGAKWGHFMVWYQSGQGSTNTMCNDTWWKEAMSNSHVITRDQLPSLR